MQMILRLGVESARLLAGLAAAALVLGLCWLISDALVSPAPLARSAIHIGDVAAFEKALAPTAPTAPTAPSGPARALAALPPLAPLLAQADAKRGEVLVRQHCMVCHNFSRGGPALVGPNLYGIVGALHAHMAGFSYSPALRSKPGPWTDDQLNQWLHRPAAYAPGTRMAFAGLPDAAQRADVIAFLNSLGTPPASALPASAPAAPMAVPQGEPTAAAPAGSVH